jgi:hypothetical protein
MSFIFLWIDWRSDCSTSLFFYGLAESPSSSASDVDNLNNQSTAAKAVSARALYSPQIAGNSIPRNNHHLMGLLAYVSVFDI